MKWGVIPEETEELHLDFCLQFHWSTQTMWCYAQRTLENVGMYCYDYSMNWDPGGSYSGWELHERNFCDGWVQTTAGEKYVIETEFEHGVYWEEGRREGSETE